MKIAAIAIAAAFVAIIAAINVYQWNLNSKKKEFIGQWSNTLKSYTSISEVKRDALDKCIAYREFKDNTWIAMVSENSCCSGEGYDVVVARDDAGNIYVDNVHCFCGYEGMCGDIRRVDANSRTEFINNCSTIGLRLIIY